MNVRIVDFTTLLATVAIAALCLAPAARADESNAPLSIVVGTPPGGSADASVRIVAAQLQEDLHRPVIVENRPGAEMMLSAQYVRRRPPDGDTILYLSAGPATLNPIAYPGNAIDPTVDLTPLSMMAVVPLVLLVSPNTPVHSMAEFVAYAKAHPGELNYASAATTHRIATEMLMLETGTKMTLVPYNGAAAMITALLSNEAQVAVLDLGTAFQAIRPDGARALATASLARVAQLPDVPTASELGYPGFVMDTWGAFFGPPGLSKPVVQKLNCAIQTALVKDKVKKLLSNLAFEAAPSSPDDLTAKITRDREKFRDVLIRAHVKL